MTKTYTIDRDYKTKQHLQEVVRWWVEDYYGESIANKIFPIVGRNFQQDCIKLLTKIKKDERAHTIILSKQTPSMCVKTIGSMHQPVDPGESDDDDNSVYPWAFLPKQSPGPAGPPPSFQEYEVSVTKIGPEPKNNDGLEICFWCRPAVKTQVRGEGRYRVCPKCGR